MLFDYLFGEVEFVLFASSSEALEHDVRYQLSYHFEAYFDRHGCILLQGCASQAQGYH